MRGAKEGKEKEMELRGCNVDGCVRVCGCAGVDVVGWMMYSIDALIKYS